MSNFIVVEDEFGNVLVQEPIPVGTNTIPVNIKRYGDPHWDNVVLAMHMDGTNGPTAFIDETGKTVTRYGNAVISTTQSAFPGGSSAYFDGVNSYLTVPHSTDLDFVSSDFTIELFLYLNKIDIKQELVDKRYDNGPSYTGWALLVESDNTILFYNTAIGTVSTNTSLTIHTLYHVALVRQGTTYTIFINGVHSGSGALANSFPNTSPLRIGVVHTISRWFNGYIDDLRITKGVARYTENFDIPTEAFPNFKPMAWNGRAKVYTTGAFNNCDTGESTTYKIHNITLTNNSVIVPTPDPEDPYEPPPYVPPILPPYVPPVTPPVAVTCAMIIYTNYTASIGDVICASTANDIVIITIPETALPGQEIIVKDYLGSWSANKYLRVVSGPAAKMNFWLWSAYWSGGFNFEVPGDLRIVYVSDAYGWDIWQGAPTVIPQPTEPVVPPSYETSAGWVTVTTDRSIFGGTHTIAESHSYNPGLILKLPTNATSSWAPTYIKSIEVPTGITWLDTQGKKIGGNTYSTPFGPLVHFNFRLQWVSESYGWDIHEMMVWDEGY